MTPPETDGTSSVQEATVPTRRADSSIRRHLSTNSIGPASLSSPSTLPEHRSGPEYGSISGRFRSDRKCLLHRWHQPVSPAP
jgi:hypothetical protein